MIALKNLKLNSKLNIILVLVTLLSLLIGGLSLSKILEKNVETQVDNKAFLIMELMNSVRQYTINNVRPELTPLVATSIDFIPETVPSYSAKEVFEELAKQESYKDFNYKEATLNPTNLRDKADDFEAKLVEEFRNQSELQEVSGFRKEGKSELYYIAKPIQIKQESCLECHSTPEAAPKSLIETYGSKNGFDWQLNEIVGAQVISVPANDVFNASEKIKQSTLGIIFGLFASAIIVINLFIKYFILQPVTKMSVLANKVSTSDLSDIEFDLDSKDEIGNLASSLNRMMTSLKMAMEMIDTDEN